MTEAKYDKKSFRKYIYTLVSIHQKSRLIRPFSKTVTVSTTFLDKNMISLSYIEIKPWCK